MFRCKIWNVCKFGFSANLELKRCAGSLHEQIFFFFFFGVQKGCGFGLKPLPLYVKRAVFLVQKRSPFRPKGLRLCVKPQPFILKGCG